ncbi:MAG TPA: metallopeptidase TldD-related protein [Methylomirabilota bacterium]|nr:metallopeptidase TldD-related protein [Methylomirabilota bacterium]
MTTPAASLGPTTADLARTAREALELLHAVPDVLECEVFVAANGQLLARLAYASHLPSNGLEEPKSTASHGLGLQVVFRGPDGPRLGFGSEPSDLSPEGVRRALAKARTGAVHDPTFVSLPRAGAEQRALWHYHDPRLLDLDDERLVAAGWRVVTGALRAFIASSRLAELAESEQGLRRLGLLVGGDVTIVQERVAIASTQLPEVQTDESTLITAAATAMVEAMDAKGSGWSTGTRFDDFTEEAGVEAARAAIRALGGERVRSGRYRVVLGPQPVADLLNNLVLPALHASSFYASTTPFLGRFGQRVAAPTLSIYDHGALPGLTGSKGITCEGLPTGRTDLVSDGVLTGLLTNWYEAQRLVRDPQARAKLGIDPGEAARGLVARNGFRFAAGGGRSFASPPGTAATNVFVESRDGVSLEELCQRVGNGLYVGRIWYTYPINGLKAGDFTCTVVGDSYLIRDGRIAAPLKANAVRISDNITSVLEGILAVTREAKGTTVWGGDEVVYAPSIAVAGLQVDEIAGFVETL